MAHIVLEEKKVALAFGCFAAVIHFVWSIFVAAGVAQGFANWLMGLHMVSVPVTIGAFNWLTMILLIIVTFIIGAIFGFVFAKVWNWAGKQKYF